MSETFGCGNPNRSGGDRVSVGAMPGGSASKAVAPFHGSPSVPMITLVIIRSGGGRVSVEAMPSGLVC